jgi:hypothetical protein
MADAVEQRPAEKRLERVQFEDKPEGPIAAVIIAGGVERGGQGLAGVERPGGAAVG